MLECFCLGDVSLSVRLLSGAFLYFPEQELSLLDETALQAAIAYRKEGHNWALHTFVHCFKSIDE